MKKQVIRTIDDIKQGFFGNVTYKGVIGDFDLYVAEIADPYDNDCGWGCADWYLVKDDKDAYMIANCNGYNGVDIKVDADEMITLLGSEELYDELIEAITPYEVTGDLIASAREALLEDADEDYAGECAIWVTRYYYRGTQNAPSDGFLTDDDYDKIVYGSYAEAKASFDELRNEIYYLSHGEAGRPSYRIVKQKR